MSQKTWAEKINEISDVDVAFSTDKFLPEYQEIPDEFKRGDTKWNELFNQWFYHGLKELEVTTKDGMNGSKAVRCIQAHMSSFSPKHEHKEAGVAYMMSMLFEDAVWE